LPPGPPTPCNAGSNASQTREAALPVEEELQLGEPLQSAAVMVLVRQNLRQLQRLERLRLVCWTGCVG
jgi:hypothetical protein